jgi:hypothetical protein
MAKFTGLSSARRTVRLVFVGCSSLRALAKLPGSGLHLAVRSGSSGELGNFMISRRGRLGVPSLESDLVRDRVPLVARPGLSLEIGLVVRDSDGRESGASVASCSGTSKEKVEPFPGLDLQRTWPPLCLQTCQRLRKICFATGDYLDVARQ